MSGNSKIHNVAEKAGVSICTVSRVFNNHPNVSVKARTKVLSAAKLLRYTPQFSAVADKIAILVEGSASFSHEGYEGTLFSSILRSIAKKGFAFEIIPLSVSDMRFELFCKACLAILYSDESFKRLSGITDIPVVTVNSEKPFCHSVSSKHSKGVKAAMEHLFSLDHSRIGFLMFSDKTWTGSERFEGYKSALSNRGEQYDSRLFVCYKEIGFFEGLASLVKQKPSAIIVEGENKAAKTMHYLRLLNVSVPDDISLVSYESENVSRFLPPPNTTISQDLDSLGMTAVATLIGLLKNPAETLKRVQLENKLIIRDSTAKFSG